METKPRTTDDIDADFANKFALVLGVIDMIGILGTKVEELDNRTIPGLFIALYYEALECEKLFYELEKFARK
jgi:hypothetical protein